MKRTKLLTLLGSLFAVFAGGIYYAFAEPGVASVQPGGPPAFGQPVYPPAYGPPVYPPRQPGYPPSGAYAVRPDSGEEIVPFISRYRVDSNIGEGLGWNEGHTSVSAFVPWDFNSSNNLFFLDLRGYATHSRDGGMGDGGGANVGFGSRNYFGSIDRIFGVSGWFDVDAGHENTFTQAGVSFESVGKWVDVRANGYFILGDPSDTLFSGFVGDPFFRVNQIMLLQRDITEIQYGGWDAEVGGPVPYFGGSGLSAFVGGYILWSPDGETAPGVQGRVEANINNDIQAGMRVTSDRVFGTNTWATVTLTLPRGTLHDWFRGDWFRPSSVHDRMDRQVQRNYRIAIDEHIVHTEVPAINPADSEPFFVLHVDSNAPTNGIGTFETPFDSTQNFVNNPEADIIRVVAGVPANLHRNGSIDLLDDQRLLSASVQHTFTATQGTFTLPGFTGGPLPELFNDDVTPAQVVSLSDNDNDVSVNEVSGFILNGSGIHDGIASVPGGITGFDINRNEFADVINGVLITDVGTNGAITREISDNTAAGIGLGAGRGFSVTFIGATADNLVIAGNTVTDFRGEDVNQNNILDFGEDTDLDTLLTPGNGIEVIATAASNVTGSISGNTSRENETGLVVIANGGSTVDLDVAGNIFTQNLGEDTGVLLTVDGATLTADFTENTIDNNDGSQLLLETRNAAVATLNFVENTFNRTTAGAIGMNIDAQSGSTVTLSATGNEFVGGNADTSHGLFALIDDSTLDMTLFGDTLADGNLFDLNRGAGIFVKLTGASDGTLDIINNTIVRTADDNNVLTEPAGDGVFLAAYNTSRLHDSVIDGNVIGFTGLGNARHGLAILASDNSTVEDILIGNTAADDGNGGLFQANAGSGIFFRREVDAIVDNIRMVDLTVLNNGVGIDLQAIGSIIDDIDFLIEDNTIQNNGTGILLRLGSDAQLDVDIIDNLIANNTGDGILSNEDVNTATDPRSLFGSWLTNQIVENGGNGMNLNAAMGGLIVGLDGVDADGKSLGNLIARNGLNGVLINAAGSAFFTNNDIIENGLLVGAGTTQGHGVDIQGVGFKFLTFERNLVRDNVRDGFEINNNGNDAGFAFTIVLDDNDIELNGGRGIDILNQGDAFTSFTATNNVINGNGLEGVYVVNTASTSQNQSAATPIGGDPNTDPTHGMNADGAITADPELEFIFDNNIVTGNGENSDFPGTGLVIRVGTAGGGYGFTDPGGFATDGAGNLINAGVYAVVTNNTFAGNFGDDVYFESFTSTVDPATTEETWDDTEFTVTTYEGDPLARLDLVFSGNVVVSLGVNNLGAFYDNAEAIFKSRDVDQTDPGPFDSGGTRRRNAQRLGFRDALDPSNGLTFLYPGIGESVFRISAGSDQGGFILDTQPWTGIADNNGIGFVGAIFGEEPFGWSEF
ncbi:MAG: hypothetical protein WD648_11440 [Planctomycetaceae bacterium]